MKTACVLDLIIKPLDCFIVLISCFGEKRQTWSFFLTLTFIFCQCGFSQSEGAEHIEPPWWGSLTDGGGLDTLTPHPGLLAWSRKKPRLSPSMLGFILPQGDRLALLLGHTRGPLRDLVPALPTFLKDSKCLVCKRSA